VIAAVDRAALLRLARETGGFVTVVPVVGEYITPDRVVLRIGGALLSTRRRRGKPSA
jgi:uncharacterized membrane protein